MAGESSLSADVSIIHSNREFYTTLKVIIWNDAVTSCSEKNFEEWFNHILHELCYEVKDCSEVSGTGSEECVCTVARTVSREHDISQTTDFHADYCVM